MPRLPSQIQQQLNASEQLKERVRNTDSEKYQRHYGAADAATSKLSITDNIKSLFANIGGRPTDPRRARSNFVDNIYNHYRQAVDRPTVLPLSKFIKFEPLYDKDLYRKAAANQLTGEETDMISSLSQEFYNLINTMQPLYVVEDQPPHKVLFQLPPIYLQLNKNIRPLSEAMEAFQAAHQLDDGVPGGVAKTNILKATAHLWQVMSKIQDWEGIGKQIVLAKKLRHQFNEKFNITDDRYDSYANSPEGVKAAQQAKTQQERKRDTNNAEYVADFEPVEDD